MKAAEGSAAGPKPPEKGSPPPSYAEDESPPNITAGFANLDLSSPDTKTANIEQCIAHLKLLEAFSRLREDIGCRDGLYGLYNDLVSDSLGEATKSQLLAKMREKRWAIYVTAASMRFEAWWMKVSPVQMLKGSDVASPSFSHVARNARPDHLFPANLPPLDVLMVCHAFILNPRNYFSDCLRFGKQNLWASGLPWEHIVASINNDDFTYSVSVEAMNRFTSLTGRPWDGLHEPELKLTCPFCKKTDSVPWTTSTSEKEWDASRKGECGYGFADPAFTMYCKHCRNTTNHEVLRAQSFVRDVQKLLLYRTPMPNTILDPEGRAVSMAEAPRHSLIKGVSDHTFVNSLIEQCLVGKLGDTTTVRYKSMAAIQSLLQDSLLDRKEMAKVVFTRKLTRDARISVRRMMACFWTNSSPFSMDLVGAVIRQGVFVGMCFPP